MKIISRILTIFFGYGFISGTFNPLMAFPFQGLILLVFIYFGWIHKFKNNVGNTNYDDIDKKSEERKKRIEEIRKHSKKENE